MNKKTVKNAAKRPAKTETVVETSSQRPLTRVNFLLMGVCGVLIVIGFLLMLGGSSGTDRFNPDIFSDTRVVVGPTLAFLGFLLMAFAIMYRPGMSRFIDNIARRGSKAPAPETSDSQDTKPLD